MIDSLIGSVFICFEWLHVFDGLMAWWLDYSITWFFDGLTDLQMDRRITGIGGYGLWSWFRCRRKMQIIIQFETSSRSYP